MLINIGQNIKNLDFPKRLSSSSLSRLSGKLRGHTAPTEELKLTCCPYSIPLNSLAVGRQCALCAVPLVGAYHFTPTCPRWSAHEPQNKTLSVFSFVEICPLCVWPGRGLSYLSKVDPCVFVFCFYRCAHRNFTFISEEEDSSKYNIFLSNRYHVRNVCCLDKYQSRAGWWLKWAPRGMAFPWLCIFFFFLYWLSSGTFVPPAVQRPILWW